MLENEANGEPMESQLLQIGVDIIGDTTAKIRAAVRTKLHATGKMVKNGNYGYEEMNKTNVA
jgi:hypothetical protein